jgi:hypothetical protein
VWTWRTWATRASRTAAGASACAATVRPIRPLALQQAWAAICSASPAGQPGNAERTAAAKAAVWARAAGLRVIGSVYTCLADVPGDLALAVEVARYRTPDGLALDGLTADIEEELVPDTVRAFGELLRHALGDDALLVATVYPPDSWAGGRYPWRALGASWNAVAPMAYPGQPRSPAEVYAYTHRALADVRARVGRADLPVEMLGQLFALGQPRLLGPGSPSADEVVAAASAARDGGAIGISFFDWEGSATSAWGEPSGRLRRCRPAPTARPQT